MKLASVFVRGAIIVAVYFTASTVFAQRPLIDRENGGTLVEIGYSAAEDIHGVVAGLQFANTPRFDVGLAAGAFASDGAEILSVGFNADFYLARVYGEQARFFISLDGSVQHDYSNASNGSYSSNKSNIAIDTGPTVTFGPHWKKIQILFSGGLHYFDYTDLYQNDHLLKLAGLAIAFSRTGTSWLGASIGYGGNNGLDTFSIGLLIVSEKL